MITRTSISLKNTVKLKKTQMLRQSLALVVAAAPVVLVAAPDVLFAFPEAAHLPVL